MPETGERYLGTVVKTTTFGAFVSLLPGKDGLLHVSQIRKLHGGKRIENVDDVIKVGEKIQVEVTEIDQRGKLSLVPVEVIEREAAEGPSDAAAGDGSGDREERSDRGERGDRGERRERGGEPRRRRTRGGNREARETNDPGSREERTDDGDNRNS
jgi:polyribonucleotide nucleotidyltransferase